MENNDYYDESIYLVPDRNKDALEEINFKNRCYDALSKNYLQEYKFLIEEYNRYLNFIAYLIKVLSIKDNTLSTSIALDILTKRGMFSDMNKFIIDKGANNKITTTLGINIISGTGCCRHIAAFQNDVISKLNLMSDPFYCYMTRENMDNAHSMKGNHVINLIEYDGTLYGYDAVFSSLFRFIDSLKLESVYSDNKLYAYCKPYADMIINGMSVDNILNLIELFDNLKDNKIISHNEYIDICRYTEDMINMNENLLRDFQESSKKYVKKIIQELK